MNSSKPGQLVPAARFFALFGYTVFVFLVLVALLKVFSFTAVTFHRSRGLRAAVVQLHCNGGSWADDAWLNIAACSPSFEGYSWADDF